MIPKAFTDELLKKTDIELLISQYVELLPVGSQLKGICPFCNSQKPLFTVSIDKRIYKCFTCGRGGNAIGFIIEAEKKSFPQAVHFLAIKLGLEVPTTED